MRRFVGLLLAGIVLACVDSPDMPAFLWTKLAAVVALFGALYYLPAGDEVIPPAHHQALRDRLGEWFGVTRDMGGFSERRLFAPERQPRTDIN